MPVLRLLFLAALFVSAAAVFIVASQKLSTLIEPNRALLSAWDGLGPKADADKRGDIGKRARRDVRTDTPFDDPKPIEILQSPFASAEQKQAARETLKARGIKAPKRLGLTDTPFDEPTPIEVLKSPFASAEQKQAARAELKKHGKTVPKRLGRQDTPFDEPTPIEVLKSPFASEEQKQAARDALKARGIKAPKRLVRTDTPFDDPTPMEVLKSPFASEEQKQAARAELKKHGKTVPKRLGREDTPFDEPTPIEVLKSPFASEEQKQAARAELKKHGKTVPKRLGREDNPFDEPTPVEVLKSPFATPEQRQAARDALKGQKALKARGRDKLAKRPNTPFGPRRFQEARRAPFAPDAKHQDKRDRAAALAPRRPTKPGPRAFDRAGLEGLGRVDAGGNARFGPRHTPGRGHVTKRHGVTVIKGGRKVGRLSALALPEQTRFPRYYRATRPWATGRTCDSPRRNARHDGVRVTYGATGVTSDQLYCGRFTGGATDAQGSPYGSRIRPGLTVEQGSQWRGKIEGGRTVEQGSQWRGDIEGGRTVEQGSRWASHMRNWRFRDYDPARFPAQIKTARDGVTVTYGGRGTAKRSQAASWSGRIKAGRTRQGSPYRSRTRY